MTDEAAPRDVVPLRSVQSVPVALTPLAVLNQAVASGASVEVLERLMALQERHEANNARKAFEASLAEARAELPVIIKNREVNFNKTNYRFEDLAGIAKQIDPILARHGITYRFRTDSTDKGVKVTCRLSHTAGHVEENSLSAGHDLTGNKNTIQAIGSTVTYLQRYTLKASLGLSASADDDGQAAGAAPVNGELITDEQVRQVSNLIAETKSNLDIFLKTFGVGGIPEITTRQLPTVLAKLEAKRARLAKEAQA